MYGESLEYLDIKQWELESGDFFTEDDVKKGSKVCVIGKTIVNELFNGIDPVGKNVRFKSIPFKVIGVLKSKARTAGEWIRTTSSCHHSPQS